MFPRTATAWTCECQVSPRDPRNERRMFSHVGLGRPELRHACYLVARAIPARPPCSTGSGNLCGRRSGGWGPGIRGPRHWGCKAGTRGADGSHGGSARSGRPRARPKIWKQGSANTLALHLASHGEGPPGSGGSAESRNARQPHGKPVLIREPRGPGSSPPAPLDPAAAPRGRPGEHQGRGGGLGPTQGHPGGAGTQGSQSAGGWGGAPEHPHAHPSPVPFLLLPAALEIGWSDRSEEPQQGTALKTSELRGGIS